MAKKQTRRSISVSRTTYERLKAFCEANNISMSQLVETRVNDFLGEGTTTITPRPDTYRPPSPSPQSSPRPSLPSSAPIKPSSDAAGSSSSTTTSMHGHGHGHGSASSSMSSSGGLGGSGLSSSGLSNTNSSGTNSSGAPAQRPSVPPIPMTSAAARFAVEPPPPIIKPKQETNAPKPAEKRADQIFTF